MKRYQLVQTTLDADGARVPSGITTYACVADFPARNRMLVKITVPDGSARTATTIADVISAADADGIVRQLDINDDPLTPAQITALKTLLTSAGFDLSQFDGDGVVSRLQLLRFMIRRLAGWQDKSARELLDGWDA